MQRNVLEYLEITATKFPNKIAIEDETTTITFNQLLVNAKSIASCLIEAGVRKNQPIAVYLPKSIKAIESFLGILYAGCFYVPMDTSNPKPRTQAILDNIAPTYIITENKFSDNAKEFKGDIPVIDLDKAIGFPVSATKSYKKNIDTDPLYILNTSGSTDIPKGVVLTHRCMIDYIDWVVKEYKFDDNLIIGNQSPLHFDISASDLYLTLATGSKLILVPEKLYIFPFKLIEYLKEKSVNFIYWVPSIISNVSNQDILSKVQPPLKWLFYGGEMMPTKHLMYWKNKIPNAIYSNFFGPTEVTVICTHYKLDRYFKDDEPLPIGFACKNTDVFILDENDKEVTSFDELGELCVRGSSLAAGYYNDPEKTAEVFTQNPLNPHYPELIYRTGDLVYFNELGELMYKGRKDFQIKHMGYRIELGEIETAILAIDGINNACVLYNQAEKSIILVYESKEKLDRKTILLGLHGKLPKYMLPNRFELLDEMPLNINGKIDRNLLGKQFVNV